MEAEISRLKALLVEKEEMVCKLEMKISTMQMPGTPSLSDSNVLSDGDEFVENHAKSSSLTNEEISRYSRQLILPEIGVTGQVKLKNTSVLIVGAGGLGCPAAIYLAAAGIGEIMVSLWNRPNSQYLVFVDYKILMSLTCQEDQEPAHLLADEYQILTRPQRYRDLACKKDTEPYDPIPTGRLGLVDYDEVELSNLHRQILHTEQRVNIKKSLSAATACKQLNSHVDCVPYHLALNSQNALQIIQQYDIVLDATDNVATRYLLNDACILAGRPLVSGSALRFEGQLTVYNHNEGPCYRCLYPKPPPPETVTNCSDGGVLGVVPGIIGSLQALEAVKIAVGTKSTFSGRMLLFDGLAGTFRTIRLRGRQSGCVVCGTEPTIKELIDYEQFCGARATDKSKENSILSPESRITVKEYSTIQTEGQPHVLVDVRQPVEQEICQLPNTLNLPIDKIDREETVTRLRGILQQQQHKQVYVVCRRGNDSQVAVKKLQQSLKDVPVEIKDIRGGLTAWARQIDHSFPVY